MVIIMIKGKKNRNNKNILNSSNNKFKGNKKKNVKFKDKFKNSYNNKRNLNKSSGIIEIDW